MHTTTTTAPVEMPVIDSPLDPEVADTLGDEILLGAVATTKTQRVKTTARSVPSVRAWSFGGGVD